MKKALVVAMGLALLAACGGGGGGGVTGSTSVPQVAGNYSGTLSITLPELNESISCPATTVVTQSGSQVSVAPLVLGGDCSGTSIPLGSVSIDSTGAIGNETGSYNDPSCGTYNYSASGGFYGREFRFSLVATSATCWNMNITGTLSR